MAGQVRALAAGLLLSVVGMLPVAGEEIAWNADSFIHERERPYFTHLHQLTFEGENAEAYWHPDGTRLIFQRTASDPDGQPCDQIYTMGRDGSNLALVSTGAGRCTCGWFLPGTERLLFASTHAASAECPERPDYSQGYVWPVYADYAIWSADWNGANLALLEDGPNYDAEAVTNRAGTEMLFTSLRDADLNLFKKDLETGEVTQLTTNVGYDGGAVFSPTGRRIAWRAHYPEGRELADYLKLLAEQKIRPGVLDLYVAKADGSQPMRLTDNGAANFAPVFTPDGEHLLFSSNMDDPRGRDFDLYLIGIASQSIERVTYTGGFDGFPMFSDDGKYLAFCSNRNPSHEGNTNVFVAEWLGPPATRKS